MISRRAAMAIAEAYTKKLSFKSSSGSNLNEKVYRDNFYDYLYEHEYEAWFCNMVNKIFGIRSLKEWLLKIHTGESLASATPNWPWEKRMQLGQVYLKNLARDFIFWYRQQTDGWTVNGYKNAHDEVVRRLEMDGYVYRDGELRQTETEVLDVEAEKGLLEALHVKLGLSDRQQTFEFLKLAEDHYVAGRWSDCIGNARKFFEAVLQQVANRHAAATKGASLPATTLQKPISIRISVDVSVHTMS